MSNLMTLRLAKKFGFTVHYCGVTFGLTHPAGHRLSLHTDGSFSLSTGTGWGSLEFRTKASRKAVKQSGLTTEQYGFVVLYELLTERVSGDCRGRIA